MTHYERTKRKLEAFPARTHLGQKEANRILNGTSGYIWCSKGKYGWSTRTSVCYRFNSARAALNDIIEHFRERGL